MLFNDKLILKTREPSRRGKQFITLILLTVLMSSTLVNGSSIGINTQQVLARNESRALDLSPSKGIELNKLVQSEQEKAGGEKVKRLFTLNHGLSTGQFLYIVNNGNNVSLEVEKIGISIKREERAPFINHTNRLLLPSKGSIALLTLLNLVRVVTAGPYPSAACVAGCCAALGQIEEPSCVLHCWVDLFLLFAVLLLLNLR